MVVLPQVLITTLKCTAMKSMRSTIVMDLTQLSKASTTPLLSCLEQQVSTLSDSARTSCIQHFQLVTVRASSCWLSTPAQTNATGTGKTSLLEGRKGIAIDDDSTNTSDQEGLAQLIGTSLFELLEDKQVSSGAPIPDQTPVTHFANIHNLLRRVGACAA